MNPGQFILPNSEYRLRWQRLRQKMAENKCDLVIVYGDDRAFAGPGNIRYLCDYAPHFEPAFFVMPRAGRPFGARPAQPIHGRRGRSLFREWVNNGGMGENPKIDR